MNKFRKTDTLKLAEVMDILSKEIESEDGVANAAIAEAAQRLRDLEKEAEYYHKRMCALIHALKDAISVFDSKKEVISVTGERIEAWESAINL